MKVSKSVLKAIAIGLSVGAVTTACDELKQPTADLHLDTCDKGCTIDHSKADTQTTTWDDCPACGMG